MNVEEEMYLLGHCELITNSSIPQDGHAWDRIPYDRSNTIPTSEITM